MTFESRNNEAATAACHIRSACKRESDSRYFKGLFECEWDYFVIKPDANTGEFRNHIACCGKSFETRNA